MSPLELTLAETRPPWFSVGSVTPDDTADARDH